MLISETCIPTSRKIEQAINRVLLSQVGKPVNANFNWDEHPVIQTVRRERWDTAAKMWGLGVPLETINDQLDLKLPECPGWKTAYLPFNVQPISPDGQVEPPPEKNPDFAEEKIAQLKAMLDPSRRMQLALAAPRARPAREIALWKKHMNDRRPHVNAYQAKFNKALFAVRTEVLAKLDRREKSAATAKAVAGEFLFNLHEFTGKLFAAVRPAAESSFLAAGNGLFEEVGRKDLWTCPPEKVLQFVKQRENMLKDVPDEIFEEIKGSLQAGLDAGDPIADIAKSVKAKFNEISSGRAKTIAMTETAAAYGHARNLAMQDAGISKKQWLTSGNDNVRPAHEEANGQIVDADEAFDVGGEPLRFPGDPDGEPENIINCHCVAIPVAATEDDES
jgi:SPP1 gp7 family putative phage head morphogenesis protein